MFLQKALLLFSGEKSNHETADTQLWWKRGQDSAQGCLFHQLMEESLFRSRHGSRSLLNSSNFVAQSKSMSTKLLRPSQPWLIRCGPRRPRMRHNFCAPHLPYWSVGLPRNVYKRMARIMAWEGGEERNTRPGAVRAFLCPSIPRIQAWSPAHWKGSCVSNLCVYVEGSLKNRISASVSAASWKPSLWFSQSAVWCKHFSVFGWQSWFVLLVLHISRIQLQFFHCR